MSNILVIRPSKVIDNLKVAEVHHNNNKHGLAMLHFNAACFHALSEMPLRAGTIRELAERYRQQHFPRRAGYARHHTLNE